MSRIRTCSAVYRPPYYILSQTKEGCHRVIVSSPIVVNTMLFLTPPIVVNMSANPENVDMLVTNIMCS